MIHFISRSPYSIMDKRFSVSEYPLIHPKQTVLPPYSHQDGTTNTWKMRLDRLKRLLPANIKSVRIKTHLQLSRISIDYLIDDQSLVRFSKNLFQIL